MQCQEDSFWFINMKKTKWVLLFFLISSLSTFGKDKTENKNTKEKNKIIVIGEKKITGEPSGTIKSSVGSQEIKSIPKNNGTLSDILETLPGVQVSEKSNSSKTAGEILPAEISISGAKPYQNNYQVDGVENNNRLDPVSDNPHNMNDVPGHSQNMFIDTDMIESVTVYHSNVPASYGRFLGGVVDAKTIDPKKKWKAKIYYRTTRDAWTSFHINQGDEQKFLESDTAASQPHFEKHHSGVTVHIPIAKNFSQVFSYSNMYSIIPLQFFTRSKDQWRMNQNFMSKWKLNLTKTTFRFSLGYSPYKGQYYTRNTMNSDFFLKGGGYNGKMHIQDYYKWGTLDLTLSYQHSENSRNAPLNYYNWANTKSVNWGRDIQQDFSAEGGFGTIEKEQDSVSAKLKLVSNVFHFFNMQYNIISGIDANHTIGFFKRAQTSHVYKGAIISPDIISPINSDDTIHNEQYFTERNVMPADRVRVFVNDIAYHLQTEVKYKRVKIAPGIRLDFDDFMKNLNTGLRLPTTFDIWGNKVSLFTIGLNRYYGQSFLTYKLREARKPFVKQQRTKYHNRPTPWENSATSGTYIFRFSNLKTPYTNEASLKLKQLIFKSKLDLSFVYRENKNEFARTHSPVQSDGLRHYTLNNNGESKSLLYSARFSWSFYKKHFFSINTTYSSLTANILNFDETFGLDKMVDKVWFQGKLIGLEKLPKKEFNRPLVLNVYYMSILPYGFNITTFLKLRSGYTNLENTGELRADPKAVSSIDPASGEILVDAYPVFEVKERPLVAIVNIKILWHTPKRKRFNANVSIEINNLFNTRTRSGASSNTYELGRQFWLGTEIMY